MKNYILILAVFIVFISHAQPGKVLSYQRVSFNVGNLKIPVDSVAGLGWNNCLIGDLDGDGRKEIFSSGAGAGGLGLGYILSLNANGTIYKSKIIGKNRGFLNTATPSWVGFGSACANIGDLDKDGIMDIAIGNYGESGYGGDVFIAFMNANGSVKNYKVIAAGQNGFNTTLGTKDKFGSSIICLGDIDNDRTTELVVGAHNTNDGSNEAGAIWILSIDSTGFCKDFKKISDASGGGSVMKLNSPTTRFGKSLTNYKDLDGDKIPEFIVGAPNSRYYGAIQGKLYCLSINANKTLKTFKIISDTSQNFGDTLINPCFLAESIGNLGDIDGNGFDDIVVGSSINGLFGGYFGRGNARVLLMENDFKIKSNLIWDSLQNGIPAYEHDLGFGFGLFGLGDINNDGKLDAMVGLPLDSKQANLYGAFYILFLDGKVYPSKIDDKSYQNKIIIFPNPVISGKPISIVLPGELLNKEFTLSIYSVLGQEITSKNMKTVDANLSINDVALTSGMYILIINNEGQSYHFTLNVE